MNSFFNTTKIVAALGLAAATFAVASPALACDGYCQPTNPPSMSPAMTEWNILGSAGTAGVAAAVHEGQQGFSMADKLGGSTVDIILNAQGDGCPGGCGTSTFSFKGTAFENANAAAAAFSEGSGVQSAVSNMTRVDAMVGYKITFPSVGTAGQ